MGKSRKKLNIEAPTVAAAPVSVPPTKAAKKDKRSVEEVPEERASCKKQKIETEQVGPNVKKVKKLKKVLIESPAEKTYDGRSSDFEEGFAAAPITVSPMKAAEKGKRGTEDATEKLTNSKNQIIEVEKLGRSKKVVKKLKKTLIESPEKKKDETGCSDFGGELKDSEMMIDSANMLQAHIFNNASKTTAKLTKMGINCHEYDSDGCEESNDEEPLKFLQHHAKRVTDNKRWDSLPDGAKNNENSKISEKKPETPAKRNEESGTKRLFIGNLQPEVIKDDLLEFFEKAGEVTEVRLATKEDGSFRGFGHVEFVTEASAQAALRMNGHMLLGRRLIVDFARERGSNNIHTGIGAQDPSYSVYVKGFGKSLEEDQIRNLLKEHFGFYGEIIRVSIPQDNKTGRSKGFAYVLFNDQVTASKSLELNGTELGGYTLTVQKPTPKSGPCDGAYGGGRGRGGRSAGQGWGRDGGCRGRGSGRMGPGACYNRSATTASKGKRTTFGDDD